MYGYVHNSIAGNSKNLATCPMLSKRRMDKLWYTHTMEYHITVKTTTATCDKMDDSYKCNTEFKNANPRRLHIACLTWDYLKSVYVGGRGTQGSVGGAQNSLISKHQQTTNSNSTNATVS